MKKLIILTILLSVLISQKTLAQLSGKVNAGLGFGLDYGGYGAQLSCLPIDRISLFGGVGYNMNSLGYNLGARWIFPSENRVSFNISGMYGYNAVLIVKVNETTKTTYFGPSFGGGLEIKSKHNERTFWSLNLFLPLRPKEYHNAIDDLKLIGYSVKEPLPIAFSFGYHIKF